MRIVAILGIIFMASGALAGPYDGLYRPDVEWAEDWDCSAIGTDGGALEIANNQFRGVESLCELTNPVEVRDMNATLYDAECSGEGETYGFRMMILKLSEGIAIIQEDDVNVLKRCE